jgi:hypothetical protein
LRGIASAWQHVEAWRQGFQLAGVQATQSGEAADPLQVLIRILPGLVPHAHLQRIVAPPGQCRPCVSILSFG